VSFFDDLTPYCYFPPERERSNTVNIGWIDRWHPFPVGPTSAEFREKLRKLCLVRVNRTRGIYHCDFCKGRNRPGGSAEMRVVGAGRVYAAPELVYHYVVAHSYKPPEEFIAAVLARDEGRAELDETPPTAT
jgi:hypothetical protein